MIPKSYNRASFGYSKWKLNKAIYKFNRCKNSLIEHLDFVKPEEAIKTKKFWVESKNYKFIECDRNLGYVKKHTKNLANTKTGKDLI